MNAGQLREALDTLAAHWPAKRLTSAELDTWRRVLQPYELSCVVAALDTLAPRYTRGFAPDTGVVLEAVQAEARRRAVGRSEEARTRPLGTVARREVARQYLAECRTKLGSAS